LAPLYSRFYDEKKKKEQVELWDVDEINTLETYHGKVRVIRAVTCARRPILGRRALVCPRAARARSRWGGAPGPACSRFASGHNGGTLSACARVTFSLSPDPSLV